MSTMTISLPVDIARRIDNETKEGGFSTRSEFIRNILRRYFSGSLTFEPFMPRPLKEVRSSLEKTGKYNKAFINSVMRGLARSSWYAS